MVAGREVGIADRPLRGAGSQNPRSGVPRVGDAARWRLATSRRIDRFELRYLAARDFVFLSRAMHGPVMVYSQSPADYCCRPLSASCAGSRRRCERWQRSGLPIALLPYGIGKKLCRRQGECPGFAPAPALVRARALGQPHGIKRRGWCAGLRHRVSGQGPSFSGFFDLCASRSATAMWNGCLADMAGGAWFVGSVLGCFVAQGLAWACVWGVLMDLCPGC